MAAFTDQFTRRDPFTFRSSGTFARGLARAVEPARALLAGRDVEELIHIGVRLEAYVAKQASLAGVRATQELWGQEGPAEDDPLDVEDWESSVTSFAESERNDQGAIDLYESARAEGMLLRAEGVGFEHWEALAVVALWAAALTVGSSIRNTSRGSSRLAKTPIRQPSVSLSTPAGW